MLQKHLRCLSKCIGRCKYLNWFYKYRWRKRTWKQFRQSRNCQSMYVFRSRIIYSKKTKLVLLLHPPYAPNMCTIEFSFIPIAPNFLSDKTLENLYNIQNTIYKYPVQQPIDIYRSGIENLLTKWQKLLITRVIT